MEKLHFSWDIAIFPFFSIFFLICILKNKTYTDWIIKYFDWAGKFTGIKYQVERVRLERFCLFTSILGFVVTVLFLIFFLKV